MSGAEGSRRARASLRGRLSALYEPVWTTSVHSNSDVAVALSCFVLLVGWRFPPVLVVALGALGGLDEPWLGKWRARFSFASGLVRMLADEERNPATGPRRHREASGIRGGDG
jgi:hypothetical protein